MALVSYITSIQKFTITLTESVDISKSANLAAGTVIENCVPFLTYQTDTTSDYFNTLLFDVYFTGGSPPTVTVERGFAGAGNITATVFVIEFDGTNVEVQSGMFDMETNTTDQVVIDAVTLTKTAAIAYHKMAYVTDDWDDITVKVWFSDTTHIDFLRDSTGTGVTGHWYTFEAQGTEFTVQDFSISITSGNTQANDTITAVVMNRSMVIGSISATSGIDDADNSTCRIWLYDTTHVYAERVSTTDAINISGFVIQFNATDGVDVQRGEFTFGTTSTNEYDDITAVTQANSIAHIPSPWGIGKCDGTANNDVPSSFVDIDFVDSDTVDGTRGTNGANTLVVNWEVIDFTEAGAPPEDYYSGKGIGRGIGRGIIR